MVEGQEAVASVVIPAHNEERSIGRLLSQLAPGVDDGTLEVIVVCNGCTDGTAQTASRYPGVLVLDIPEPSKHVAMRAGSAAATVFPRLYVDADIEISAEGVTLLAEVLGDSSVLASAPSRRLQLDGVPWVVRWYYDVWQELPHVQTGLFGRGVIAVSAEGQARFEHLPPSMSDDLVLSDAFDAAERQVVESAHVVVRPPRTVADLLRRRVRVGTGNRQADAAGLRRSQSHTRPGSLLTLVRRQPRLIVKVPVFVAVSAVSSLVASRAARRSDFSTWLRDESSRQ